MHTENSQKQIAILKAGETFAALREETGDFDNWFCQAMGLDHHQVQVIEIYRGEPLPPWQTLSAALITGSHSMVTDRDAWMLTTQDWLRKAVSQSLPVLGICFGHQLLAEAFGGEVSWNLSGREIGTHQVSLTAEGQKDKLLGRLPVFFHAHLAHQQSVTKLPEGARLLATSDQDCHQAFAYGSAYGLQFHPEFNELVMLRYIELLESELFQEGADPGTIKAQICPTPEARSLLSKFATWFR
ncbi:MAG: glutamine amidotransferase, partial [Deltaproteobacteria bacterium]|jgi:GMP synthase (glutamine-hydrolysing)|nr:glutamine amidotransferase [Deltaproteobacteria bacterium]